MEGNDPAEKFRALFQVGVIQQRLKKSPSLFLSSYEKAFQHSPTRAEPLFFMANHYVETDDYQKAYELFKKASAIPLPATQPFVEEAIYTWASLYNLSICTEKLGKKEETAQILERLSQSPYLPTSFRNMIEKKRKKF